MPQDLFKWEDGGILSKPDCYGYKTLCLLTDFLLTEHHCPICQTPLSHDKCRTTCLGKHVEWCHRYHSLFRKNWSSRCQACKTTDEQREKRHREIAEILAKIRKFKLEEEAAAMEVLGSPLMPRTPRTPLTAKALNTMGSGDAVSPFTLDVPKSSKKERKAAKRAAKVQDRDKVVTMADIAFVAKTLHPEPEKEEMQADAAMEATGDDADIKENLKFNSTTWNTKSDRHEYIIKERGGKYVVEEAEIERLLGVFEVDPQATGREKVLVDELAVAIKSDLVHAHDELANTARQKAGFWRWANRKHYRSLVDNGKEWDDKNSQKRAAGADVATAGTDPTERRDSASSLPEPEAEEDDSSTARSNSIDTNALGSAGTAFTVPSTTAALSTKKAPVVTLALPATKKKVAPVDENDGWSVIGKKQLKPVPTGKITLTSNGGLKHLAQKPKDRFGALSWADVAKNE